MSNSEAANAARAHLQPVAPRTDSTVHDHNRELQRVEAHLEQLIAMVENLRIALETRDVIGQAKGIIMASTGCSPDAAFELLRMQSQAENRKLITIATELVARRAGTAIRPPTPPVA